jgi:hypothetical protein
MYRLTMTIRAVNPAGIAEIFRFVNEKHIDVVAQTWDEVTSLNGPRLDVPPPIPPERGKIDYEALINEAIPNVGDTATAKDIRALFQRRGGAGSYAYSALNIRVGDGVLVKDGRGYIATYRRVKPVASESGPRPLLKTIDGLSREEHVYQAIKEAPPEKVWTSKLVRQRLIEVGFSSVSIDTGGKYLRIIQEKGLIGVEGMLDGVKHYRLTDKGRTTTLAELRNGRSLADIFQVAAGRAAKEIFK